jgi:chromosome segregation ATPase
MAAGQVSKSDIEEVLKVNEKAVALQAQNAEYFEDIISSIEKVEAQHKDVRESSARLSSAVEKLSSNVMTMEVTLDRNIDLMKEMRDHVSDLTDQQSDLQKNLTHHIEAEDRTLLAINNSLKELDGDVSTVNSTALDVKQNLALDNKDLTIFKSNIETHISSIEKKQDALIATVSALKDTKAKITLYIFMAAGPLVLEVTKLLIAYFHK